MKLYLARHGEAVHQSPDALRPLSEQGINEVKRVGAALGSAGIRVDRIWHSGKLRAEQTATLLAGQLGYRKRIERVSGIAPNDPVAEFARDMDVWQEDTMVVGHMPFLGRLAGLLLRTQGNDEPLALVTGGVVCMERSAADSWLLHWVLTPVLCGGVRA